jgi:hypothetical protein
VANVQYECAIDVSLKSLPTKIWQISAMVNVGVAQDYGVDSFWIKRKGAIPLDRLGTVTLKQTAF